MSEGIVRAVRVLQLVSSPWLYVLVTKPHTQPMISFCVRQSRGSAGRVGRGGGGRDRCAHARRRGSMRRVGRGWGAQGFGLARWVRGQGKTVAEKSSTCIVPTGFRFAQKQPITNLRGRSIQRLNHGRFRSIRVDSGRFGHIPP